MAVTAIKPPDSGTKDSRQSKDTVPVNFPENISQAGELRQMVDLKSVYMNSDSQSELFEFEKDEMKV